MERRINKRGYKEDFCEGKHLKLRELKEKAKDLETEKKRYLFNDHIPPYPRPEFHVTHLKHDTDGEGLHGIRWIKGFCDRDPKGPLWLVWWSLMVRPEDIQSAETRLLDQIYPDRTEEQAQKQQSFLGEFATSPAFLDSSRLGSYRFTFPLKELLTAYSQQLCSGAKPVMRVFKTALYRQEVMHAVLVHSPANQELFAEYPLLTDDLNAVCAYRDGRFIWRPEAMCGTHRYDFVLRPDDKQVEVKPFGSHEYYVWDNVAIALHMEIGQSLKFDSNRLRHHLTYCDKGKPPIIPHEKFHNLDKATDFVKNLWPNYRSPLKRSLKSHAS